MKRILVPGPCGRYPRLGGEADTVNGQLLLVNVVIILENVTQIPDLNMTMLLVIT